MIFEGLPNAEKNLHEELEQVIRSCTGGISFEYDRKAIAATKMG